MPSPDDITRFLFLLIRAKHGHGRMFGTILDNVQPHPTMELLKSGVGLYHATEAGRLQSILKH